MYDENESDFARMIYIMTANGKIDYDRLSNDFRRLPPPILMNGYEPDDLLKLSEEERMRALIHRNEIWIEAAFVVYTEEKFKVKNFEIDLLADIRFIMKDIDDVQRLKATGKNTSLLKPEDLPSSKKNETSKDSGSPETDPIVRKAFLANVSKKYAEK